MDIMAVNARQNSFIRILDYDTIFKYANRAHANESTFRWFIMLIRNQIFSFIIMRKYSTDFRVSNSEHTLYRI